MSNITLNLILVALIVTADNAVFFCNVNWLLNTTFAQIK